MGSKRKTDTISSTDEIKIVPTVESAADKAANLAGENGDIDGAEAAEPAAEPKKVKKQRQRSPKYVAVRAQVDKTKKYTPQAAIELVKKLSYAKFDGTITAHAVVKDAGVTFQLTLPHSSGRTIRVAVVDDAVLKNIEAGKLDFDILIAHPQFMPKLARFASTLGPKGLMPNPKNGTLTPNPEAQKKKLEAGTVTIKTEKKAPLLHIQIGKCSNDTKKLAENLETLIKTLDTKLVSMAIAASMSPGVKVDTTIAE